MKHIFMLTGFSRNYGDLAIRAAMKASLAFLGEEPLNFIDIDLKQNSPITREDVDLINQGDCLLLAGGGLVMKGDGHTTRSGWQFNISKEDLAHLQVPLFIYGIGYNHFPHDGDVLGAEVWEHLKITQLKSTFFSARNPGTRSVLQKKGLNDMVIVPDAGMFAPGLSFDLPHIHDDHFCIGLNWAGDRTKLRFGTMDEKKCAQDLAKGILRFAESITNDVRVIWMPHVSIYDNDPETKAVFQEVLKEKFYDLPSVCPWLYPETEATLALFVGVYDRCAVTIGMRGHANIIPFGRHTPVVGIGEHSKVRWFHETIHGAYLGNSYNSVDKALTALFSEDHNFGERNLKLLETATVQYTGATLHMLAQIGAIESPEAIYATTSS